MDIKLTKKPKNAIIIDGFPGYGLVGTIANEYLLEHLDVELIGKVIFDEMPPMVAVHEGKLVEPLGIFYNKKYNLVILHAITASTGFEGKLSDVVLDVAKKIGAKEIVGLEGVGSSETNEESKVYYYSTDAVKSKKFDKLGVNRLKEGIIMGVNGAVLIKTDTVPVSCIFAETHSQLPDSKAAAKVIEALDKYLGLKVDYKPLADQAEKFESKLKGILTESERAKELSEQKRMNYVG